MKNQLLSTLVTTAAFASIIGVITPQEAMARANFVRACKDGNTGNALIYYNHNGDERAIYGEPRSNGRVDKGRVKSKLRERNVGLSNREAEDVKDRIPNTKIRNMSLCTDNLNSNSSDFPIVRGSLNPTNFHSVTDSNGNVGADAFQQFANTESSALDLNALNARKLDTTQLELIYDNDVKVYFVNEGAGYKNQLRIGTTGTTVRSGMVFNDVSCHSSDAICQGKWSSPADANDALKPGDYVNIGNLAAGTKLDFQVLANGYVNSNPDIWYTDDSLNSDGLQHVIAYAYEGYLVLGWEDIRGGGDRDYNDVVFAIYIGEDNLNAIPTDPNSNSAPDAVDDVANTPYQTPVTIDVLNGDTDADGDTITLDSIAVNPSNGRVSMSGNSVVYTPDSGFSGVDTFEYTAVDSNGATGTATVTVTVQPAPILSCPVGSTITLTGTLRDFSDSHPDFERTNGVGGFRYGVDTGITTDTIGSDSKPVYAGGSFSTTTRHNFDEWYRDVDGVNKSTDYSITLTRNSNGKYRFQDTSFFPLDGMAGFDTEGYTHNGRSSGRPRNFHFTYELHSQFTYTGGEVLEFSGDDDVWVYINGKKVIDLGGVHGREDASVDIDREAARLGLVRGETYDFDFFFAERHTTQSNFILETNLELLCDTDNDGIANIVEGAGDADGDGIANYEDTDSDNNGIDDGEEGTQDSDGDGTADYLDNDNDNNGYNDIEDSTEDGDGDGIMDYQDTDDDNDGIDDANDNDIDGDGIDNSSENNPNLPQDFTFPQGGIPRDIDGDGVINSLDPDSDGNGVYDTNENNGDYDEDGTPDPGVDNSDNDIDDDGVPNSLDTNDDGDDLTDISEEEYYNTYPNPGNRYPHPGIPDIYRD